MGLSGIAWVALPLAIIWLLTGVALGAKQERLRQPPHGRADPNAALSS
jgi:hypothetical protein